jgi:protein required for attachment to host cells
MIKHPTTTWILVAHRTGAALYQSLARGEPLQIIERWDHPEGRLKPHEVESDRPGRSFDRVGGGRHALASRESVTDHVDHAFIQSVVEHLERARSANAFDGLVLVALPHLLGELRQGLSEPLRMRVIASLDKDLTRLDADELRTQLKELASL